MDYIQKLDSIIREALKKDKSGHDYAHALRVLRNAEEIAANYQEVDSEVLTAACLLHDIAFEEGWVKDHHIVGAELAGPILEKIYFPKIKIKRVQIAIEDHVGNISEPIRENSELSIESKILRDADNIDALGEIGLQRAISFNTSANRSRFKSKNDGFQDSLYGAIKGMLTWSDKMLTPEGRRIGESRLPVMKDFLKQLEKEYS
ncbi:MAG: HD domain-containing protein [Nanoarchaeota archaeon]